MKQKDNRFWDLKQSVNNQNELDLFIYGDIEKGYYDWWEGRMFNNERSADYFKEQLEQYKDIDKINVFINSYGGSVFEATSIQNQLKRHSAEVIVNIDGFACSAASVIAMAGDTVIMPSNTMMMIHNMWMSTSGNANQLRQDADVLDKMMEANRQVYLQKSNGKITEEKLIELLDNETWLTAEECLEIGFCDVILDKEVDMTEANQLLQKFNNSFEQQVTRNKMIAASLKQTATLLENPIPQQKEKEEEENQESNFMQFLAEGLNKFKEKGEKKYD